MDLGSSQVKLAQVHRSAQSRPGEAEVMATASHAAAPPPHDAAALTRYFREVVRPLLDRGGFRGRRVALALPAAQTHITRRRIPFDRHDVSSELAASATEWLGFPAEQALIRHVTAGAVYEHGSRMREVVAFAVRRCTVDRYLGAANAAKIDVEAVMAEPSAILATLAEWPAATRPSGIRLIIDLGRASTRVYVAEGSHLLFARTFPRLPAHRIRNGDVAPNDPIAHLIRELHSCRHYYDSAFATRSIGDVLLIGGGAADTTVRRAVVEALELPTSVPAPLPLPGRGAEGITPDATFLVALGLSLASARELQPTLRQGASASRSAPRS